MLRIVVAAHSVVRSATVMFNIASLFELRMDTHNLHAMPDDEAEGKDTASLHIEPFNSSNAVER